MRVVESTLDTLPVSTLRGVGPKSATRLAALGIETVEDVLFHLPRRYEDRTRIVPIGGLRSGATAVVEAEVDLAEIKFGRRRSLLVRVSDGTGALMLRFFHFSRAQQQGFVRGSRVRVFGEVRRGPGTLYNAMTKMLDTNLIVEASTRPAPEEDDPRRRYYHITEAGRAALEAEAAKLERLMVAAREKQVLSDSSA